MVGHLLCISLHHRDLVPHLCYVLLEVRGDNKGVELLEASFLLAPVRSCGRVGEQSDTQIPLLQPPSPEVSSEAVDLPLLPQGCCYIVNAMHACPAIALFNALK